MDQPQGADKSPASSLYSSAEERTAGDFTALDHLIPGASMMMLRENPTCAIVRFKAGAVEPAHHSTRAYDLVVISGKSTLWNLSNGGVFELRVGDCLHAPAGDVQRVKYHEDTEMFIKWDGEWDTVMDEDLAAANAAIDERS